MQTTIQATIVFQKNWEAIHKVCETCNGSGVVDEVSCSWCGDGESKFAKGSGRHYKYILNVGSSRSSKTASIIQVCDLYARGNLNKRITAWRDTKKDCKDTVLQDALKYFKQWGIYRVQQDFNKTESIFTYNTSSTFEIHGTDDEEKVMGLNKSVAWLNEPYKLSEETVNQIDQRTEDFVIVDLNPKKNHWSDNMARHPRAIVIHSTFRDNPFCPPEQKAKILSYQPVARSKVVEDKILSENEAKLYDIVENPCGLSAKVLNELIRCRTNEATNTANDFNWCVYGLGKKGERPHRIFHWKPISIEEYRAIKATVEVIGNDWGTVDPWAIIECKYLDGKLFVHERNYASENQIRGQLTPTELAQVNAEDTRAKTDTIGIVKWKFNQLQINRKTVTVCDNNRVLKIAALRGAGYLALPALKVKGSIVDGIDILNNIEVFYTSSSTNIEYEQENYSWKVDSNGVVLEEPEDLNNHCMDAIRYVATYLLAKGYIRRV